VALAVPAASPFILGAIGLLLLGAITVFVLRRARRSR